MDAGDASYTTHAGTSFSVSRKDIDVAFTAAAADQRAVIDSLAGELRQTCGWDSIGAVKSGGWVLIASGVEALQHIASRTKSEYIDLSAG